MQDSLNGVRTRVSRCLGVRLPEPAWILFFYFYLLSYCFVLFNSLCLDMPLTSTGIKGGAKIATFCYILADIYVEPHTITSYSKQDRDAN